MNMDGLEQVRAAVCPYCGGALEKGELRSRGGCFFLPEGKRVWLYAKKSMEKAGAVPLPPSPNSLSLEPEWPEAYCCKHCRRIIISY